jgi:hypothetical protein
MGCWHTTDSSDLVEEMAKGKGKAKAKAISGEDVYF